MAHRPRELRIADRVKMFQPGVDLFVAEAEVENEQADKNRRQNGERNGDRSFQ